MIWNAGFSPYFFVALKIHDLALTGDSLPLLRKPTKFKWNCLRMPNISRGSCNSKIDKMYLVYCYEGQELSCFKWTVT